MVSGRRYTTVRFLAVVVGVLPFGKVEEVASAAGKDEYLKHANH